MEVDFSTGSAKNSPEVGLFPFPVFKFSRLHLSILAKTRWKWGLKMAKMLKKTEAEVDFSTGSAKNLPEVDLFPFPVFKFHLFWPIFQKNFQKKTNFLGISTGSSSISPKSADFSNFWRLHALCGKKLVKMGSKNGKIAKKNGSGSWFLKHVFWRTRAKSLKFTRFFTPKPEIQGFYCVFKRQYFQFSSKIS